MRHGDSDNQQEFFEGPTRPLGLTSCVLPDLPDATPTPLRHVSPHRKHTRRPNQDGVFLDFNSARATDARTLGLPDLPSLDQLPNLTRNDALPLLPATILAGALPETPAAAAPAATPEFDAPGLSAARAVLVRTLSFYDDQSFARLLAAMSDVDEYRCLIALRQLAIQDPGA